MTARLYTEEQLHTAVLPGFLEPATLGDSLQPDTDWQTVLSLTVVHRGDNGVQILNGIRREDTNSTHPGIVSTPTGRLPRKMASAIITEKTDSLEEIHDTTWTLGAVDSQNPKIIGQLSGNAQPVPDHEASLPYATGALLASKLGCSAILEASSSANPIGTVSLETLLAGFSYVRNDVDSDEPLFEPLIMLGATVRLYNPSIIATTTESYRMNSWVDLESYKTGHANKDASLMLPGITSEDEVTVCVRGLCLATSSANIADERKLEQHISEPELISPS